MRRLPKLTAGSSVWRLPISARAAGTLAEAFLEDDLAERGRRLSDMLSGEPSLVLWCVCRAKRWQAESPGGIADLADWLGTHGLEVLRWSDDESRIRTSADGQQQRRWAELSRTAVLTARRAARLADGEEPNLAYLCGLLHGAGLWLASSGSPISLSECAPGTSCMPAWLVQFLRELEEVPPRTFRARTIARAIEALRESPGEASETEAGPQLVASGPPITKSSTADDGRTDEGIEISSLLPALIRKLSRLQQLETDFQKTLDNEKLEALKEFAYGASHEINNPLANISTRAQTLLREEKDPERRRKLAVINSQAFRAHELIADMMLFARPPELHLAPVNLTALVDQVIEEVACEAEDQGTDMLRVTSDDPVVITADEGHLAVALKALVTNSLEALSAGGRIEFFVEPSKEPPVDSEGDQWVQIHVSDTGPGLSEQIRRHLFDPYFSGREAGRGLGLGLSKCWRIVTEHGGRIEVGGRPDCGTTFTIRLPVEACPKIRTAG
jgi:signal transduction histidine kinase